MKLYDGGLLVILGILAALALTSVAATKIFKLEDDNLAEEFVEEVIESKTGLDLDLSPSSPEKS
ncbi:hypothetical protein OAF54_02050 [bacterium]|nr:hypothetical protein [bacterium]